MLNMTGIFYARNSAISTKHSWIDYSPVRRYSSRQRKRVFKFPIHFRRFLDTIDFDADPKKYVPTTRPVHTTDSVDSGSQVQRNPVILSR